MNEHNIGQRHLLFYELNGSNCFTPKWQCLTLWLWNVMWHWTKACFHTPTNTKHSWLAIFCLYHSRDCYNSHSHVIKEAWSVLVLSTQLILFTFLLCPLHLFHLSLFARCGGTVGAILTCPLEVVKTRLQSSSLSFYVSGVQLSTVNGPSVSRVSPPGPLHFLKWVFIIML